MLQIAPWKRVLILLVAAAFRRLFAVPNLFYGRVETHNDAVATIEKQRRDARTAGGRGRAGRTGCRRGWSTWGSTCAAARISWPRCIWARSMATGWTATGPRSATRCARSRDQVGAVRRQSIATPGELRVQDFATRRGWRRRWTRCAAWPRRWSALTNVGATRHRGARRRRRLIVIAERGRADRHRRPHHAAVAGDHPPPGRRGRHPRADDPAPGRRPHPDRGAGHRLGRRAEGADRHHREADLPPGGRPAELGRRTPIPAPGNKLLPAADEKGVYYVLEQTRGGRRRRTDRRPAVVRPERPAGGQLPLQPDRGAQVRRLHRREYRQALRHRARRRGDLGAA